MSEEELVDAMTFGSRNPSLHRRADDLGRFGLGLKTASLSQCRLLAVASRKGAQTSAKVWDLAHVSSADAWELLDEMPSGNEEELRRLEALDEGTIVIWRDLDRVIASANESDRKAREAFLNSVENVEKHLEMVFHRYIEGPRPWLNLYVQNRSRLRRLTAWDPFLLGHISTSRSPVEYLHDAMGRVEVQGFILPHKDLLSREEYEYAAGPEGWIAQQGFYVYRSDRMLVGGSWLGLGRERGWIKEDSSKLARLSLNFTNASDAEWQIDIKKSKAHPPHAIRPRLRDLAEQLRRKSRQVIHHRVQALARHSEEVISPVWQISETRLGYKYRVNREHPFILSISQGDKTARGSIETLIQLLETTIPVQRLWAEASGEKEDQVDAGSTSEDERLAARAALRGLYGFFVGTLKLSRSEALHRLRITEPLNKFPDLIAEIAAE